MNATQIRERLNGVLADYPPKHHAKLGRLIFDIRSEWHDPNPELEGRIKRLEEELQAAQQLLDERPEQIVADPSDKDRIRQLENELAAKDRYIETQRNEHQVEVAKLKSETARIKAALDKWERPVIDVDSWTEFGFDLVKNSRMTMDYERRYLQEFCSGLAHFHPRMRELAETMTEKDILAILVYGWSEATFLEGLSLKSVSNLKQIERQLRQVQIKRGGTQ